jgi:hypothetical protein
MKNVYLTGLLLFFINSSFSQEIEKCLSHKAIEYQESFLPGFTNSVDAAFNKAKALNSSNLNKDAAPHTIPVVVHIVHNNAAQNIPDSVVFNQIQILNEDFNRLNADTVNMRPEFEIVKGNPQVEFMLANIDPNGDPTTGITRTQTSLESFGSLAIIGGDFSDLEKVKSTIDGGIDPWDQARYLNIWVCNMSVDFFGTEVTALLGYATPPSGLPNWPGGGPVLSDGVVIQYQAFGSNNPNVLDAGAGPIDVRGRTPVHEVGHYLGLRHIWGDGDCTAQDGIDDTPNADAQSNSDCDPSKNTCVDDIQGVDLPDMIENFMDYSAETCQNSFTEGQVSLILGVLSLQRYDLCHNNPASVKENTLVEYLVYPNPTSGEIVIESNENYDGVNVYSTTGRLVFTSDMSSNTIDLSSLNNGVYVVRPYSNGIERTSKRVVLYR